MQYFKGTLEEVICILQRLIDWAVWSKDLLAKLNDTDVVLFI